MAGKGKKENLKPFNSDKLTVDEQRKIQSDGGKASGDSRRKTKIMKEMLEYLLEKETIGKNGEKITTLEQINVALVNQAKLGDVKAYNAIRDTIGQKPVEQVEQTNLNIEAKPKKKDVQELKKKCKEIFGIDLDSEDEEE